MTESAARDALDSCDQNWEPAHRLLVRRAQRDPRLREAIRVYCAHLERLTESDAAGRC